MGGFRGLATSLALFATVSAAGIANAQGRCAGGYGTPQCPLTQDQAVRPIRPVFAPTGWRTTGLDQITLAAPDYRKEAAYFAALMGWRLRSDDGTRAVMDIEDWGTVVFLRAPEQAAATVRGFGFVIAPWDAKTVEHDLRARGLAPVADNGPGGFESFHVKDPDGFDLQISNGKGLTAGRRGPRPAAASGPFAPTGWRTTFLDHLSFWVTDYKESASFYENLLGWRPGADEGSQIALVIGDTGSIVVRGGNPFNPGYSKAAPRVAVLDHISFGISPWNADAVRAAFDQRGIAATVDAGGAPAIQTALFQSYHVRTPNGFDLQISNVNSEAAMVAINGLPAK
jgi:catechol 2,3-dioxygenase-like lactoylglutathione lyase family enzyme